MAYISLKNVSIQIPVYTNSSKSIKNSIVNIFRGIKNEVPSVEALGNLSLTLKDGDRLGIMGPNGSGKTTLLRTIAGVYSPSTGKINVKGKISSLLDISLGMDFEATGYENIRMRGIMMGLSLNKIKNIEEEIADFSGLKSFLNMPIRTYSSGMLMRLGFSVSTAIAADIIIMDEWLSVGDDDFLKKAEQRLNDYIKNTSILVIASHSEELINKITNKKLNLK